MLVCKNQKHVIFLNEKRKHLQNNGFVWLNGCEWVCLKIMIWNRFHVRFISEFCFLFFIFSNHFNQSFVISSMNAHNTINHIFVFIFMHFATKSKWIKHVSFNKRPRQNYETRQRRFQSFLFEFVNLLILILIFEMLRIFLCQTFHFLNIFPLHFIIYHCTK